MCYKIELQKKNEEKLNKKLDEENVPDFIRRYLNNIDSKAGAITYWNAIRDLLLYLIEKSFIKRYYISEICPDDFIDIEPLDIKEYLVSKENNGMASSTLENRKQMFSSFWAYMVGSKKCPITENIIKDVSYKAAKNNYAIYKKMPEEAEINQMMEKILKKPDPFAQKRNSCMFRFLLGTGIREGELANLDISDLHFEDYEDKNMPAPYIEILGKGSYRNAERRPVFVTGDAIKAVEEWLEFKSRLKFKILDENALFINHNGKRCTEKNIKDMFKTYGGGLTPHMVRHYYLTKIAKIDPVFAQQQAGHSSGAITTGYYISGASNMKDNLMSM